MCGLAKKQINPNCVGLVLFFFFCLIALLTLKILQFCNFVPPKYIVTIKPSKTTIKHQKQVFTTLSLFSSRCGSSSKKFANPSQVITLCWRIIKLGRTIGCWLIMYRCWIFVLVLLPYVNHWCYVDLDVSRNFLFICNFIFLLLFLALLVLEMSILIYFAF